MFLIVHMVVIDVNVWFNKSSHLSQLCRWKCCNT